MGDNSSAYAAAMLNPNIKFVIEDLGEEIAEASNEEEEYASEEYASEYDDEVGARDDSFHVEVELAAGVK